MGTSSMHRATRCYALVAGSHPTLPHAELEGIVEALGGRLRVLIRASQLVVFESSIGCPPGIAERSGFVEEVGMLLNVCDAHPESVKACIEEVEPLEGTYRVEFRRVRGYAAHLYADEVGFRKSIVRMLEERGWNLSPRNYTGILRVIVEEGFAVIGVQSGKLRVSALQNRWPHVRPFYKPGALDPRMARLFVNLGRVRAGDTFLDPFCGTGGFAIEAKLSAGAGRVICGDVDRDMAEGAPLNLSRYVGGVDWDCLQWDATRLPLRDESVDSIATDPPYGRITTTAGRGLRDILEGFAWEASRVLRPGGYVVYACPHRLECYTFAEDAGLVVKEVHFMRVHGSLTRILVVARRL